MADTLSVGAMITAGTVEHARQAPMNSIGGTALKRKKIQSINWETILQEVAGGNAAVEYSAKRKIFWQGQPGDSIFYIRQGKVKLAVASKQGKEAIVAVLSAGDF